MARHFSRRNSVIAQEIIDHQDNSFGIQIESIVTKIKETLEKRNYEEVNFLYSELTKLVFSRLGIKIKLVTNGGLAYTQPVAPEFAKGHALVENWLKDWYQVEDYDKIIKELSGKKGFVDLQKAKVGGIFSKYEHEVGINFNDLLFTYKMTPPEVTAIILHELGHDFTYYEFIDRLESTNQVLANIGKHMLTHDSDKNLEYVFNELKSINDEVTKEQVEKILTGPKAVSGAYLFKAVIGITKSQLMNDKYNETSSEQLADSFAARFGYGRQIVLALDKLHGIYIPEKNQFIRIMSYFMSAWHLVSMLVGIIVSIFVAVSIPGILVFSLMLFFGIRNAAEDRANYTYDDLRTRYKRIRNEYIDKLKDSQLSNNEIKDILENVKQVDAIIEKTSEYRSLFNLLGNFIFSEGSKTRIAVDEQKMMEQLAFNDLFFKAAELKTL